ncbi:MAG TPA: hypothetical protein VME47_18045 [Acetobacteraceae bacterium]|nr:hypothetical protein [Acetobacteraceae bacterium]
MHEAVGKAGPGIDIAEDLDDANTQQHAIEPDRQVARRFRHDGLHASM